MTFWPYWPQMIPDWRLTHNIGRVFPADAHAWVSWSSYTKWMSYGILNENDLLTPVTPNDPRLTFDSITYVKGPKLINMYDSHGHAM